MVVLPVHVAGLVVGLHLVAVGDFLGVGVLDAVLDLPVPQRHHEGGRHGGRDHDLDVAALLWQRGPKVHLHVILQLVQEERLLLVGQFHIENLVGKFP